MENDLKYFVITANGYGLAKYMDNAINQINERIKSLGLDARNIVSINEDGLRRHTFVVFYRESSEKPSKT